jgi:Domain of unknown function (DUF4291)
MKPPQRQIRAHYDDTTITVYQAYNASIASPAVSHQKLNASPSFRKRMTWIKPSWAWMMYRSGYSFKDTNQERILAIKMSHAGFLELLRRAELTHGAAPRTDREEAPTVKVQWDPERDVKLAKLDWRSIQIGIPGALVEKWIGEWIVAIEDVTEAAHSLKKAIDENPKITLEELTALRLVPGETPFEVPADIRQILGMQTEHS